MLDHLAGGERAEPARGRVVGAAGEAAEEPGGEEIAGAGRVDHLLDRRMPARASVPSRVTTTQPFSLRVTTASFASVRSVAMAASKSTVW